MTADDLKGLGWDMADPDNPKPPAVTGGPAPVPSDVELPVALYGIDPSIVSTGIAYVRCDRPYVKTWRVRPDRNPWGKEWAPRPSEQHDWNTLRLRALFRRVSRILHGAEAPSVAQQSKVARPADQVIVEDTYFGPNSGRAAVALLGKAHAACLSAAEWAADLFLDDPRAVRAAWTSEVLVPDDVRRRIREQFKGDARRKEVKAARWAYAVEWYVAHVGPCPYLDGLTQPDERDAFALAVAVAAEITAGNA